MNRNVMGMALVALALLTTAVRPAAAQDLKEKLAAVKQAAAANQQELRSYAWLISGKRGPSSSRLGPRSGFRPPIPIKLTWSVINIRSPGSKAGLTAPAALVTTRVSTPMR